MKGEIVIENWTEVVQNCDQEDLPPDKMTVCKNLRPVPGKLVKTQGAGLKLDAARDGMKNLVTYIDSHLSGDKLYIAILINQSTKKVTWYAWNGVTWTLIENVMAQFTGNGTIWYHKVGKNPIIQNSNILRFLPGNVGKADGSNESKGLWLGYLDRDYFDELYSPSAAFYNAACTIDRPDISTDFTFFSPGMNQGGDYNTLEDRTPYTVAESDSAGHFFKVLGDCVDDFAPGVLFTVNGSTANDGMYKVASVDYIDTDAQTRILVDNSFFDLTDSAADGTIKIFSRGYDTFFYKLSYVYDGIQESLLSDEVEIKYDFALDLYGTFYFGITKSSWNKRITAMKVYRSSNADGPYNHIHTIDFIRKSEDILSAANGGFFGHNCAYVPGLSDYNFNAAYDYKLYIRRDGQNNDGDVIEDTDGSALSGTGHEVFKLDTAVSWRYNNYWDADYYLMVDDGGGYDPARHIIGGAYAGERVIIVSSDTGLSNSYGGFVYSAGAYSPVSSAATVDAGLRTKFTASFNHGLKAGDVVLLNGFTTNTHYNDSFVVMIVDSATAFTVDCEFGSDEAGSWALIGNHRMIEDNYGKAVMVRKRWTGNQNNNAWKLARIRNGLYYAVESGGGATVEYLFFENSLTESSEHPLAGEVSIKVNAEFARPIGNRLWQGNVVLDPGGKKEETHEDWITYSKLLQYDTTPVGNIFQLPDLEGGPVTGILEVMGNPVILKKYALFFINASDAPASPSSWRITQSPHNIGNIAKQGSIDVLDSIYFCDYDGIYRLNPNNLAESDRTPTESLKISDQIDNIYNAMTEAQKEAVKVCYNKRRGEVVFTITFTKQETDYHQKWAYNTRTGGWRELGTVRKFDLMALDENANVMVFDDDTDKVYSLAIADSAARSTLRIPVFSVTDDRGRPIRWIYVTYVCASDQALRLYTEHSTEPLEEFILPATDKIVTNKIRINRRAKKASIEITEDFSGYALVKETPDAYGYLIVAKEGGANPNTELHKIRILGDFDKSILRR